jgi:tetratricopeptide (TPR) repeat protein
MLSPSLLFAAALLFAPAHQDDVLTEARGLLDAGQLVEAAQRLTEALAGGGADERATRLLLAEVQVAQGHGDEALDTLGALDPGDYEVALARSTIAFADEVATAGGSQDDITATLLDANERMQRAVELAPAGDHTAAVELGYLQLYRFSDWASAKELADAGLAEQPDHGEFLLLRGCAGVYEYWAAKQSGDEAVTRAVSESAADDLTAAARALPRDRLEPWGQLVWLHEDAGRPVEAVDAAIKIAERSPDETAAFDTLYRLAKRYSYERRFDASSKALEMMVLTSAREITSRLRQEENVAEVATELHWSIDPYMNRNDPGTARTVLASIVAADPESTVVWNDYAITCQLTGRFDDAVEAYERLLQIDDSDPRVHNDLAAILQFDLERDLDRAKQLFEKCIAMADEQLKDPELTPEWRDHLEEARSIAQGNLGGQDTRGGLLGTLVDGLRSLSPELPGGGEGGDGQAQQPDGAKPEGETPAAEEPQAGQP